MSCRTPFVALLLLFFASPLVIAQQPLGRSAQQQPAQGQPGQGQPGQGQLGQGQPALGPPAPGQPAWYPLPPEHEKHLNEVLKFWEFQAAQIQRYRCKFTRWEYDPIILPKDPETAAAVANGNIQFAAPDKGLFKVEKLWKIALEQQGKTSVPVFKDGKPEYVAQKEVLGEHWVCDGKSIFQFDSLNKQLIKRALPPDMQGKQITEGPLPFLFGAKAQAIKERYWIHVVSPPPKPNHFWLEAIPKRRAEAADFKAVHVVIDDTEFLPTALILDLRAGGRTTYEFSNREKNWNMLPAMLNPFQQQFYAPTPPSGWKLVEEPFQAEPAPANPITKAVPLGPAPPKKAQLPSAGPMRR